MRLRIRQVLAVLTALLLAVGGFSREAMALAQSGLCQSHHQAAAPPQPAAPGQSDPAAHHQHQAAGSHQHEADEPMPADTAGSACFKCCGICTTSPNLTAGAQTDAVRVAFTVFYLAPVLSFSDRPLVIDPGIPKRIA